MASSTGVIEKTRNPLIRLIIEIIRHDSSVRRPSPGMIAGLETRAISLTPGGTGEIWDGVVRHAAMERETIALAENARRNCRLFVLKHLLTYLIEDEQKHDRLLAQLEDFKRGIYPYA